VSARARRTGRERAGRRAETLAAWWLGLKGFRLLARRWRTPVGELDLVARRGDLVVFVEVKRRPSLAAAAEAVDPLQRARVVRAAELYLARQPVLAGLELRFDAVLIAPWRPPRHLPDAWRADEVSGRRAPALRARRPGPR